MLTRETSFLVINAKLARESGGVDDHSFPPRSKVSVEHELRLLASLSVSSIRSDSLSIGIR